METGDAMAPGRRTTPKRAWLPHCVHVFGQDTMSPESIVSAAGRDGSRVPALIEALVDSRTWVVGCCICLLAIDREPLKPARWCGREPDAPWNKLTAMGDLGVMFATSGRAQLAYEITGVEDGAEVLLIHAGVNDRRSWHQVIEQLSSRHRCVAFDQRGFGETTYEREDGWSPVADALAVLDAAGVARPVVIACSMGGQTAIDLALAYPDRVAGLVLIGTAIRGAPYPNPAKGPTAELNARIEAADEAGDVDELGRLDAWMWLDGPSAKEGRVDGRARELFLDMNARALRASDPGEQAEISAAWPRLGAITTPTLVMIGRLDAEDVQAIDEQAAQIIPGARLRWLDGVAHVPHLEGDAATLEEIADFVNVLS